MGYDFIQIAAISLQIAANIKSTVTAIESICNCDAVRTLQSRKLA